MKKTVVFFLLLILSLNAGVSGCAQKEAATSNEAIKNSQTLQSVEKKVEYLLKEAEAFYNSKKFQEAVSIAQYILANLDKDSQQAKDLLEKAKSALSSAAKSAVEDVKKDLGSFGK